jgi:hypothetical protein
MLTEFPTLLKKWRLWLLALLYWLANVFGTRARSRSLPLGLWCGSEYATNRQGLISTYIRRLYVNTVSLGIGNETDEHSEYRETFTSLTKRLCNI